MINKKTISIIGGAGHVGFPLGLVLCSKGFKVNLIDKNQKNIILINSYCRAPLLSIMVLLYAKFISSNSFCVGRYVL